jgi:splicing factor 45
MMAKMGYVKGQGLGKNNDGVTTHLEVKMRKDQGGRPQARDDFDEDSGGRAIKSQQVFDITGGLKATSDKDYGPFGEPSRVLVTWGCIDGVDLERDSERDDGGIRQEMGDAFNAKVYYISAFCSPWLTRSSSVLSRASTSTCPARLAPSTFSSRIRSAL